MSDEKPKKKRDKYWIDKKEFTNEIILCKELDDLTDKAVDMFMRLAKHANRRLPYSDPRDREDCIQSALLDLVKYWRNFKPEISDNAFAFFTQIAKNGYAKAWNKIHKHKVEFISLDYDGDSEIYTM